MAESRSRRPLAALLISLLLFGAALFLIGISVRHFTPLGRGLFPGRSDTRVDHGVVLEQVRSVAQLVTSETTMRDVVVYQSSRLGSTKRSLVVVTGKVMAGIDLDAGTEVNIDHQQRRVHIALPRATVLAVEVIQLKTYDERSGLWNPFRPADRDTIYHLAREQLRNAAGELGAAAHAEESARRLLTALIHPGDYTMDVTFGRAPAPVLKD
ncbi:MAG TPA: DUF4230 domain-containing protein [Gemmatimonadales bacterium]|nr:DUF4230 domain-containing protein [Gemmatimonadales bacterium]